MRSSRRVARQSSNWLRSHYLNHIGLTIRGLKSPTNREIDISALPGDGVSGWKGYFAFTVFAIAQILLVFAYTAAALTAIVLLPATRLLYTLKSIPGAGFFGLTGMVAEALEALDPFLSKWLGDAQRYLTHQAWSARVRGVVEQAIVDVLRVPDAELPQSLTIVAHSWGAVVAYDAMRPGGAVADAIAAWRARGGRRVTFVTLGGAMNRALSLAERSTDPHAMRFCCQALDPALIGAHSKDLTPKQRRERFFWLDIHARLDPVPAGRLSDRVVRLAGLHPIQVKRRRVINEDNPLSDHTTYLANRDLVVPRILRAILAGEYPWRTAEAAEADAPGRARVAPDISTKTVRDRTFRVALIQLGRLTAAGIALGQVLAIALIDDYREFLADEFGSVIDHVPLLESLIANAADKTDVERALIFTIWVLIGLALTATIPALLRRALLPSARQ